MSTIEEIIEKLETERAQILYTLCERVDIWDPNLILSLVSQARTITRTMKMLKDKEDRGF